MSRILVTGAAGFAGSGLCRALAERGHEVTGLDIIAPDELSQPFPGTYLWMALQDVGPEHVWADVVVHLAAQADVPMGYPSPRWTWEQNALGTVHLLEACRISGRERFLYAGTAHELEGNGDVLLDETAPLTPCTPYGASKAAAELACWAWHRSYGLPITIMSNGVVVGPGMRKAIFLWRWLTAIKEGRPIILEGDGSQGRDLTYVSDVVDAWILAIEAPLEKVNGEKFQVSYGEEWTMSDLLRMTLEVTGQGDGYPLEHRPARPGEGGMRERFNIAKAQRVLGYKPKVGAQEAIERTWELVKGGGLTHGPA